MRIATAEEKFDRFAADYYRFLAAQYALTTDFKLKVMCCNQQTWTAMVPRQIRDIQFRNIFALTFGMPNGKRPTENDKRTALIGIGYPAQLAGTLARYEALLFTNLGDPARLKTGEPLIWNVPLSHHILHLVEVMADVLTIREPAGRHDYESEEALEPFRKFTAAIGIDEMIDRYVPCKD